MSCLSRFGSGLRQSAQSTYPRSPGNTPETVQAGHSGTVERDVSAALLGARMARTDQQFVSVPGHESYIVFVARTNEILRATHREGAPLHSAFREIITDSPPEHGSVGGLRRSHTLNTQGGRAGRTKTLGRDH